MQGQTTGAKTRKGGLVGGATNRGLHGGVSKQQSGVQKGHTRTKNYTRGGTTTESNDAEQDKYKVNALGVRVDITPKPLFISRKSAPTHDAKVADGEESKADKNAAESKSKPKEVTESQ